MDVNTKLMGFLILPKEKTGFSDIFLMMNLLIETLFYHQNIPQKT
jgi:hypothetical protein